MDLWALLRGGYLEKKQGLSPFPPMLNFYFIFFSRGKSLRAVEIDFLKTVFCCSKLEDGPAYLCFGAKKKPELFRQVLGVWPSTIYT